MLLAALKLQLAALVTVAGVNTDELSSKTGDVVTALTTLADAQKKATDSPGADVNKPVTDAVETIKKAADAGDPDALYTLALWARMKLVNGINDATILEMYKKAAVKNVPAKAELGAIYLQNFPQDADKVKAGIDLIKEAEAGDNAGARRALAQLTLQGAPGIDRSVEKAIALYEKGSAVKDGASTYSLAQIYSAGVSERQADGTTKELLAKSEAKGLDYLKKAVEQDFPQAMTDYATRLFVGTDEKGTGKDVAAGMKLFEDAAKKGSAAASRQLGVIYEQGLNEQPKSLEKAAGYYLSAARAGDGAAQFWVGNATQQNGVYTDAFVAKALEDQKAGKKSIEIDPKAVIIQPNPSQALTWFRLAAQNNVPAGLYAVGVFYENGAVVDRDPTKAFALVQRAAQSNLPIAMYRLGTYYQNGFGIGQDVVAAAGWFERSAKAGLPQGQLVYGALLENGVGVDKNEIAAAKNYEDAANAGLPQAMVNMAQLYERGAGVPKDAAKAWIMASLAVDASGGDKGAADYRDKLEKTLSKDELEKAKKSYEEKKAAMKAGPAAAAAPAASAPAAPASSGGTKTKTKTK